MDLHAFYTFDDAGSGTIDRLVIHGINVILVINLFFQQFPLLYDLFFHPDLLVIDIGILTLFHHFFEAVFLYFVDLFAGHFYDFSGTMDCCSSGKDHKFFDHRRPPFRYMLRCRCRYIIPFRGCLRNINRGQFFFACFFT